VLTLDAQSFQLFHQVLAFPLEGEFANIADSWINPDW